MIRFFMIILALALLLFPSLALAQGQVSEEKSNIYTVVKDSQGETVEGFLRFQSDELTVRSRDNQEKSIPVKYIKSITLEKIKDGVPGEDPKREPTYSVRMENSQEIYTLRKKYTFSLNTNLGVVTRSIDPETVSNYFAKEGSQTGKSENGKPFIQDKSFVISLEFKF